MSGKEDVMNKYQEAYEELCCRDPIASMDETATEYPSQDYRQLNQLLETRRHLREQTPKRELDKRNYQPRRLIEPAKIEIGLPKSAWTPHRDSTLHKIYPIPEDEGEGRSSGQRRAREVRRTHIIGKEHQDMRGNRIHLPLKAKVQEEVQELQEEEEEEMGPVIPVGMRDQTQGMVRILKKRIIVVSPLPG